MSLPHLDETYDKSAALLRVLNPADTSTGGGTASAIAGSMAAALVAMVARLSLPPAGPEPEATYLEIIDRCAELADALIAGGDEDTQAFAAVMAAYRMPKSTDAEKQARSAAIQAALAHATRVPLRNAELCAGVLAQVAPWKVAPTATPHPIYSAPHTLPVPVYKDASPTSKSICPASRIPPSRRNRALRPSPDVPLAQGANMRKILLCEPNISEGRDLALVEQVADEIRAVPGVKLLDYSSDPDHNRSVFTYLGEPEPVSGSHPSHGRRRRSS